MKLIAKLFKIGVTLFGFGILFILIVATTAPGNDNGQIVFPFAVITLAIFFFWQLVKLIKFFISSKLDSNKP